MPPKPTRTSSIELVTVLVVAAMLAPLLYWTFRHFLPIYVCTWLVVMTAGFAGKKYRAVNILSSALFIALVASLLWAPLQQQLR